MKQILISEPGTQVSVKLPVVLDTYGSKVAYIKDNNIKTGVILMSEEAKEKKEFEQKSYNVEGLGEVTRRSNGDFTMSQDELNKFFKENGIPEYAEFKKAESAAIDTLTERSVGFLKDHVKNDHRDCVLKAGLGNGRIVVGMKEHVETKNPRDPNGEVHHNYGVVSVKFQHKVPKRLAEEGGALDQAAKEVEAAFKAIHG